MNSLANENTETIRLANNPMSMARDIRLAQLQHVAKHLTMTRREPPATKTSEITIYIAKLFVVNVKVTGRTCGTQAGRSITNGL